MPPLTTTRPRRSGSARRPILRALPRWLVLALALVPGAAAPAWAQLNFKPLERGDYTEVEQRMVVVRGESGKEFGLELGGDFALRVREEKAKNLAGLDHRTRFDEDFRLKLRTLFHQDIALHLILQTSPGSLDAVSARKIPGEERGALNDSEAMTLSVREAFLRYQPNPNSRLSFGKQEVSLGDRRGKVYNAITPAATFDCRAGTWCMPFGAARSGPASADWVYHWALEYKAWQDTSGPLRNGFDVEISRIIYTEKDVPLGLNLGPGNFDPANPDNEKALPALSHNQVADDLVRPVYYDARAYEYLGLRLNLQAGAFFWNADFTSGQGSRRYHRARNANTDIPPALNVPGTPVVSEQVVNGSAWETEIGVRWPNGRIGVRAMSATGDPALPATGGQSYLRGLGGYFEITPGSYRGTRLYFNGTDNATDQGAGLGHSVNNTRLVGVFLDLDYPESSRVGYFGGLYQISKNQAILDAFNSLVSQVGVEWDNMLTWYIQPALRLQFEVNAIQPNGAFSLNDATPPVKQELMLQTIARLVYRF
jgi:hypothetical protein